MTTDAREGIVSYIESMLEQARRPDPDWYEIAESGEEIAKMIRAELSKSVE